MPLVNGLKKLANWLVGTSRKPLTSHYEPGPRESWYQQPRDLPLFTFMTIRHMLMEPTVKLALAMRAAPIASGEFAYKEDGADDWTPGIKADHPDVAKCAHEEYRRLWRDEIHKLLTAQIWGWTACEVLYRFNPLTRQVEIEGLLQRRARDVQPLEKDGKLWGVRFMKCTGIAKGNMDIQFPKCIWHAHNPEDDSYFGESIMRGAYSPWADKWMNGGALDVRRLFMHKDAYGGIDMTYPNESMEIEGKGTVPCRDIAREIAEQIKAGGVTTRPAVYDENGNELWKLERASIPGNPSHILQYPKDLDVEILRGMEIPDDVLTSETSGAWQGKQVPQQAFYTGLNLWASRLVKDIKPAVQAVVDTNHGAGHQFEPQLKPIDAQMSEQEEPKQEQPGAGGQGAQQSQPPQYGQQQLLRQPQGQAVQMSLDAEQAVGEGVLSASELVQAARRVIRGRRRVRMSVDAEGHEHKGKGEGGGQFTGKGEGGGGMMNDKKSPADLGKEAYESGEYRLYSRLKEFMRQNDIEPESKDGKELIAAYEAADKEAMDRHEAELQAKRRKDSEKAEKSARRRKSKEDSSEEDDPNAVTHEVMERHNKVAKTIIAKMREKGWKATKHYVAKKGSTYIQFEQESGEGFISGKVRIADHKEHSESHLSPDVEIIIRSDDDVNQLDWEAIAQAIHDGEEGQF